MTLSRMEVVQTGRRRRWSDAEKLRILGEGSATGMSLRAIARRHDLAPNQIYTWRRKLLGEVTGVRGDGFAAVVLTPDEQAMAWPGRMEVRCGNGRTITAGRDVDVAVLAQLVAALER